MKTLRIALALLLVFISLPARAQETEIKINKEKHPFAASRLQAFRDNRDLSSWAGENRAGVLGHGRFRGDNGEPEFEFFSFWDGSDDAVRGRLRLELPHDKVPQELIALIHKSYTDVAVSGSSFAGNRILVITRTYEKSPGCRGRKCHYVTRDEFNLMNAGLWSLLNMRPFNIKWLGKE
jgi:hypothetical protein